MPSTPLASAVIDVLPRACPERSEGWSPSSQLSPVVPVPEPVRMALTPGFQDGAQYSQIINDIIALIYNPGTFHERTLPTFD